MFSFLRRKKKNEETIENLAEDNQQELQEVSDAKVSSQDTLDAATTELESTSEQADTEVVSATETTLEKKKETEVVETETEQSTNTEPENEKNIQEENQKPSVQISNIEKNEDASSEHIDDSATTEQTSPEKVSFFTRLKNGLTKTRQSFTESLASLVLGRKEIDEDLLDELEMILLTADVGIDATDRIVKKLTEQVSRKELKEPEALISALKSQLQEIIDPMSQPLDIDAHLAQDKGPFVILMVGINGVGKTTTIGKLAKKYQLDGKSVMLAAGDTFRAAAVEQLQTWGERNNVPVMAQKTGADSAAVIFDAIQSAKAKNIDVLIADTAGRLHTQSNLMEELKKVTRVIAKVDETAPHEVMLVIDAGTGQNALNQAQQFQEAVNVSGITLTKLDGTAKGGIVFALAEQRKIPIRFIGVGEQIDDLRTFNSQSFTEALFDQSHQS
jgi:fused signal recognition particle receptor